MGSRHTVPGLFLHAISLSGKALEVMEFLLCDIALKKQTTQITVSQTIRNFSKYEYQIQIKCGVVFVLLITSN